SRSSRLRRRVRDRRAAQHRRSPRNRETGASGGGQNRAEQRPIPIHPSDSPSPPRAIQNKLLIAISESRKSRRNSVHYPVNAGLRRLPRNWRRVARAVCIRLWERKAAAAPCNRVEVFDNLACALAGET